MTRRLLRGAVTVSLLILTTAVAHEQDPARAADPNAPVATVTITHRACDQPSLIEVQLEPRDAAGGGELYLSLTKGRVHKRQVLQPVTRGRYQLEYAFPEGGGWNVYLRYGAGQAGFIAFTNTTITVTAATVDSISTRFADGFARDVPAYVQPLGYAAFALITALALAGVTRLLRWLKHQPRAISAVTARLRP